MPASRATTSPSTSADFFAADAGTPGRLQDGGHRGRRAEQRLMKPAL